MYQIKGKIDSTNAPVFEKEIMAALLTEIDASGLEYISSAGLRVLLKLTKAVGDVTVCNVSSEVYDILDVTGFTSILNIKKALREVSVEGCELLGEGANGKVYRLTKDEMIKVFRPGISLDVIEQERESSRKAFLFGVPCAISYDTVRSATATARYMKR
ncbi:MAG: STAS domain-containing protein [Ruminococcus sp.]|uniref:STAS domain-containing protein n=1 Tax=Ruminococcus sp. TaxID=41978 RepID=UPI0028738334|nr:STAS domain-containing protein [Ruminococcus sp.]MBQ3285015.1 STAS domain-containing protein [Ruminococcus sp.]